MCFFVIHMLWAYWNIGSKVYHWTSSNIKDQIDPFQKDFGPIIWYYTTTVLQPYDKRKVSTSSLCHSTPLKQCESSHGFLLLWSPLIRRRIIIFRHPACLRGTSLATDSKCVQQRLANIIQSNVHLAIEFKRTH